MTIKRLALLILLALLLIPAILLLTSPSLQRWPQLASATPEPGKVTVTFLGVSTLLISDGETHLLTDGYFSRVSLAEVLFSDIAPNQARIDAALKQAGISQLDALLVLHSHFDHAMDAAPVAKKTGAKVLGSRSTAMIARSSELPEAQIVEISTHQPYRFGDFEVLFVKGDHVPLPEPIERLTGKGAVTEPFAIPAKVGAWQEGGSYAVLVRHPAGSLLVAGSAGAEAGELDDYQADYAFLASASLGKQSDAYQQHFMAETAQAVAAHTVIPVHWDDFFSELSPTVRPLPWLMDNMHNSFQAMRQYHEGDFQVLPPFASMVLTPAADRGTDQASP